MDISTLVGLILGFGFVFYAIMGGGEIGDFVDTSSILIVFGGTLASVMVSYPLSKLTGMIKVFKKAFVTQKKPKIEDIIKQVIELSYISKKQGLLALESAVDDINNPFLKKGVLLIVDGTDPELVREILEMEISNLESRHLEGQGVVKALAKYAPAFGMIGTLIGLIKMLKNLDDPSTLGPSMAIALVTTFYGALLANVVFLPIANKLALRTAEEAMEMEIFIEGMLAIQAGETPYIIEEKLKTYISENNRKEREEEEE